MNLNPNLSPYQIKTILEDTADKIEGKEDFNTKRGFGRINVYEAAKLIKENKIPAGKFFSGKLEITVSPITTGHVVSIYTSKNVLVALGLTNSDGKAEFRGLLPGTYKVKVKTMDGKIYSRDINILNNSSSDISVAF